MKKGNRKVFYMTLTGCFAALITIFTAYIVHIPVGINGGYIHFGDSLIYLAAAILPTPYAIIAAAIGGGLADLLTAPMWTIATVIIKSLIVLPLTSKHEKIVNARNVIGTIIAFMISATGHFLAEKLLFGTETAFLSSVSGSIIQSGGSAVFFVILGTALDKAGIKSMVSGSKENAKEAAHSNP